MVDILQLKDLQNVQVNTVASLPTLDNPVTGVREFYDAETKIIKQRATFFENKLHGPLLMYNDKGCILRKFEFLYGKLNGISEFYRDNNLYGSVSFVNGILEGVATYYDIAGDKKMYIPFVNGVIEGEMIFFGILGNVAKVIPYEEGKKQGIAKSYYPSGALAKTEPFLNNLLDGNVTQYYENGKVCAWNKYIKGKLMEGPRIFNKKSQEVVLNR